MTEAFSVDYPVELLSFLNATTPVSFKFVIVYQSATENFETQSQFSQSQTEQILKVAGRNGKNVVITD